MRSWFMFLFSFFYLSCSPCLSQALPSEPTVWNLGGHFGGPAPSLYGGGQTQVPVQRGFSFGSWRKSHACAPLRPAPQSAASHQLCWLLPLTAGLLPLSQLGVFIPFLHRTNADHVFDCDFVFFWERELFNFYQHIVLIIAVFLEPGSLHSKHRCKTTTSKL